MGFQRFPKATYFNTIRYAIEHAPLEAGKRIKFQGFERSNYGSKEMGEALKTIEKALLIQLILFNLKYNGIH